MVWHIQEKAHTLKEAVIYSSVEGNNCFLIQSCQRSQNLWCRILLKCSCKGCGPNFHVRTNMHVTKSLSFKHIAEMFCFGYKICIDEVKCEKKGNKKFERLSGWKWKVQYKKYLKGLSHLHLRKIILLCFMWQLIKDWRSRHSILHCIWTFIIAAIFYSTRRTIKMAQFQP